MKTTRIVFHCNWAGPALLGLALCTCTGRAQTPPAFTSIQRWTNGEVRLQLSSVAGQFVRIFRSSNLLDWNALVTMPGASVLRYTNVGAVYQRQGFYKAEALIGTDILTGDHLATDSGDVVIHPLDHATFVMQWDGKMIYNDPDSPADYTGLAKADLILISHDHTDHYNTGTIEAVRKPTTVIIASQLAKQNLLVAQQALTTVLANGASTSVLGLTVAAVPAYNPSGSPHPPGRGNGYILTLGGRRIYMSGDTGDIPETRALRDIDVAFVCMNTPYTMTVDQAIGVVRAFQPAVIFPYHYRNSDNSYADLNKFKAQVGTDLGIEVLLRKWY